MYAATWYPFYEHVIIQLYVSRWCYRRLWLPDMGAANPTPILWESTLNCCSVSPHPHRRFWETVQRRVGMLLWAPSPTQYKPSMPVHTCNCRGIFLWDTNPSPSKKTGEMEEGVSKVQGHSLLHTEFEANLGYTRPYLNNSIHEKYKEISSTHIPFNHSPLLVTSCKLQY